MTGPGEDPRVVVIGVGNEWRRDDGVGWAVARAVDRRLQGAVSVVLTDGEPTRLLAAWEAADLAVVIDAMRTGSTPGAVCTLSLRAVIDGETRPASPHASHALGVSAAARLGHALGCLPGHLVVVGVEGADFSEGAGLSPAVSTAVDRAVEVACHLCDEQLGPAPPHARVDGMASPTSVSGPS